MKHKKVLIVDDEVFVRVIIKDSLKSREFIILEGNNGQEAIELAIKEIPDLILLDAMMPKMNGFTACEILRSNPITSHIPIVMLTARGEQIDKERGARVGAVKYLTKPFSPRKLADQIIEIIENPAT